MSHELVLLKQLGIFTSGKRKFQLMGWQHMRATAMSLVSCDVREGNDCSWHPEDQIWVTRWRQPISNGTVTVWTIFFFFFLSNINVNQALDLFHCILFCWFEFSLLRSSGILVMTYSLAKFAQNLGMAHSSYLLKLKINEQYFRGKFSLSFVYQLQVFASQLS